MMIFDKARENAESIKSIGHEAIARGKREGVPVYYDDPSLGGLVKHMPDGTRELVRKGDVETASDDADGFRR